MAQQYLSWFQSMRWAPVLGVAFLAACGGGSNDDKRQPVSDREVAPLAANPSTISIRYAVADLHQGVPGNYTRQLAVVDSLSGAVVWQTTLGFGDADYPGWLVSDAYQQPPGAVGLQYQGPQLLYYVRNGQVFQVDIGGSVTPAPQRISSLVNACGLSPGFFATEADGRHDWFVVRTPGPDGDCDQPLDNGQVLVSTGMSTALVGPSAPAGQAVILSRLINALGQTRGLLTLDADSRRIVMRSTDLTQILHTLPGDVAPDLIVRVVAPLPDQATRWLIQIGTQIHQLNWTGATPVLGPALTTLVNASAPLVFNLDNKALYLANGQQILSINTTGAVSTLSTLPAEGGNITGLWLSSTSVLATQAAANTSPAPWNGEVLWSLNRSSAARQALVRGQSNLPWAVNGINVFHVENGLVYYTRTADDNTEDIYTIRDNGNSQTLLASGINLVNKVLHPLFSPDSVSQKGLVWCEPAPSRTDCDGGRLVSYDVDTRAKITLGTVPAEGDYFTMARMPNQAWAGAQNPLYVHHWTEVPNGNTSTFHIGTTLWLFNADTPNSLRSVSLVP